MSIILSIWLLAIEEPPRGKLINLEDHYDYQAKAIEGITEVVKESDDRFELAGDKPEQKTFTVDIIKGIDKELLRKYNLPTKWSSIDKVEDGLQHVIDPLCKDITYRKLN